MTSTYAGLMLLIFWPEDESTNSLLMNKPVWSEILRPLGAVIVTFSEVMVLISEVAESKSNSAPFFIHFMLAVLIRS